MRTYLYYGMIVVRLSILLLSTLGWLGYLQKKMRVEFALGVLLTGIGSLMFAAGIFHIMREAAWLVFFSGLWLLIREICSAPDRKNKISSFLSGFCTSGIGTFALLAVFFLVLLFRSEFTHYDNFSHWGVVAQVISRKDMFPNPADTNVDFTSYPVGSAVFIYYITEIVGASPEWLQMWAQAILMVGMLVSLFAFGGGVVGALTAAVGVLMLLAGNTPFVDLLVDTLLPVVAVGGMAFCIYYRKELEDKIWFVIPYVVFLVSVKNSGALFAVLLLVYAVAVIPRKRENIRKLSVLVLSPICAIFFWNRHVEQLFDDGTVSKHAMRVDNFRQVLADKTAEDLVTIVKVFWQRTVASEEIVIYLLLMSCILILLRKVVLKKDCRELGGILLMTAVFYVVYQLGLLGMYILSMPLEEAVTLEGYGRYHQTLILLVAGMMLISVIQELEVCRNSKNRIVVAVMTAALTLQFTGFVVAPQFDYYTRQSLENTERAKYNRLIKDYALWPEDRYLVLVSEERDDMGYLHWMTSYLLDPEKFLVADLTYIREEQIENDFNFVIMFEDTEINRTYLETQFGITEEVGYIGGKPLY